jgi:hypothetical protein
MSKDVMNEQKHYTTEKSLSDYIARAVSNNPDAQMRLVKEAALALDEEMRSCKVATNDKVLFEAGKAPKFDGGKAPMHLIPVRPLKDVAEVLAFGAEKYGAQSWREGEMIAWSRSYSAILRHLMAFHSGEDNDPETGRSHLAHAACCVLMLIEHTYVNPKGDDRFKDNATFNNKVD